MTGLARRMQQIAPFRVMQILARARQLESAGTDIVHMEIGEPDFPSTPAVLEAGRQAVADGLTHYTPANGLPQLREAIANYYQERFGVDVDPIRVIVTPGASGALQLVLGAIVDPGDRVLLTDPGYPCNRHMVIMFGGVPVALAVGAETGFRVSAEEVATQGEAGFKALMLASPANPTGNVFPLSDISGVLTALEQQANAWLIVDEIYQGLQYDSAVDTALALDSDRLVVINSFSKFFGMTGWRVGWAVVPEALVEPMGRLAQNIFLAASTPGQYAALASFGAANLAELEKRRQVFAARRDLLFDGLADLGFGLAERPKGAFYLYADVSAFTDNSEEMSRDLLETAGVAVTPGADFGSHRANAHLRFAYTTGRDRLEIGIERIRKYLRKNGR